MLALGGLIVGAVELVVAALAWGEAGAPIARPDPVLTGAGKV